MADAAALAAAVVSAATPPAAAAAASAVLDYLARHAPADHPRAFFADAFPAVLYRLFVSSPSSPSFLDLAAADPDPALAGLLLALLAPSGPLLAAAAAADRRALIRFVFPSERLPYWLRVALADPNAPGRALASPLLAARVGSELHLSVFEYFLFWFAYYPVSSANPAASISASAPTHKSRSRIESWVSTLAPTSGGTRKPGQKPEPCLYLKLLYAYLREFVPTAACTPVRRLTGTLLQRTASQEGADAADPFDRAEFFLHTLVQFWLVGDDFSPLPVQTYRAFGLKLPSRARAELSEQPPSPGLGDAVKLLVMYLNYCVGGPARMVFEGMTARNVVCDSQVGFWNPLIQRPMYRFVLRAFLFCPIGAVIKNATQVFSMWLAYMEPWKVTQRELDEYDASLMQGTGTQVMQKGELLYTPSWKNYVLSNYLFYSSMVVHFLGFAHKFIHSDVSSVLVMILKVLEVLSSSTELVDLLYKVDIAYHSRLVTSPSSSSESDDVMKYVPSIREQLKDWEDGLTETDADGSFLHEHWNSDLRLFNSGEDGAYHLLQLLLIRAELEIQRLPGDTVQALQSLDLIKSRMKKIFQGRIEGIHHQTTSAQELQHQHPGRGEIFTPKHPHSGRSKFGEVRYRGDWMKRPISETEVAWLARILIHLSDRLNDALRLGCEGTADDSAANPTYIKFDRNELTTIGGPKDAARMALVAVCSLLTVVGQAVLRFMRAHRVKINLRVFASKKLLAGLVLLYAVVVGTKRAFY
uniref:Sphingomyelin phosphodiesterase n=2 Tax=Hordeum vulgare subsp. vulgare TaxID=112509 RepID=A0A8I6Y531_HORVV